MEIGLIADTHGLVRPDVHAALAGVELILHAGDVGWPGVIVELEIIAPVRAVFGNTDPSWRAGLHDSLDLTLGGVQVHVSHGHELGRPGPEALLAVYDADVIVYGHTHRQVIHRAADGRLVVNPGAAGEQRYDLPPSVARLSIVDGRAEARLIELAP